MPLRLYGRNGSLEFTERDGHVEISAQEFAAAISVLLEPADIRLLARWLEPLVRAEPGTGIFAPPDYRNYPPAIAVANLRHATMEFASVPAAVRQSLADMIEGLAERAESTNSTEDRR